ncbi:hypothetical protein [Psychromonas hadalis]|uniref:hypothetical protein n=1 Tax=Psychromonas hadalis TaxID=211669 RepID=UPI0003B6D058|nr:hypothetical protein [Psychromonas hadalis]
MNSDAGASNFCGDCGKSLKPIKGFHISKDCEKCSKTTYFTRRAENGGFRVEKGDKVTISSISFSFKPQKGTHLMRPGIFFIYKNILRAGYPEDHKSIKELLDYYDTQATEILKKSDSLKEFDIETEDEDEVQKIWNLVSIPMIFEKTSHLGKLS